MRKARHALVIGWCAVGLTTACSDDHHASHAREICEDIFAHTDACLADIGCQGAVDPVVYVDQCLTEGLTGADRDAFVASSCDAVNAGSCLADASFYRDNCSCAAYTDCPPQTVCTLMGDDTLCLDSSQRIPSNAVPCSFTSACPPGWVCGVPSASATEGACIQRCR